MRFEDIHRVSLLLQNKKYRQAEQLLANLMAEDPTDSQLMNLMVDTNISQNKYDEALRLVNEAIGLHPEEDILYYQRARIYIHLDKEYAAQEDLDKAIALNPSDPDYFGLYAWVKIDAKEFASALELAETGLAIDPQNLLSINARSSALLKLKRTDEAFDTIHGALREDPDNAFTHANYGWSLLEKGERREALHHFKEALRNNPDLEIARNGMAEALKARYFFYRWFLKFQFWMNNLQNRGQWAVIFGLYIATRLLRGAAKVNPELAPYLTPVVILLVFLAFFSWIARPIGNLFLRLNSYGKYLLDKKEIQSSNMVAASLAIAIVGLIAFLVDFREYYLAPVIFGLTMMIPLSVIFDSPKKKLFLVGSAALLAAVGTGAIISSIMQQELWTPLLIVYCVLVFAFQWAANFVLAR